jgi:hypothetical protein
MTEPYWTPRLVEVYLAEAADTMRRLPEPGVSGYFLRHRPHDSLAALDLRADHDRGAAQCAKRPKLARTLPLGGMARGARGIPRGAPGLLLRRAGDDRGPHRPASWRPGNLLGSAALATALRIVPRPQDSSPRRRLWQLAPLRGDGGLKSYNL